MRVSSREQKQEGYSIPAQKKLLWDFARKNGFDVVKEFEDDETAKSAGRSNFGAMVEYVKANKDVNTVLVEKTDRLYRNFKDYVLIDELDITVFLVKENEVLGKEASSHQKFMHGIKVLMAKNYVDNLSEEVKKGLKQKAESGIYPCSTPPLGYKMGKIDGRPAPVVDDLNRDLVIGMYERFATGIAEPYRRAICRRACNTRELPKRYKAQNDKQKLCTAYLTQSYVLWGFRMEKENPCRHSRTNHLKVFVGKGARSVCKER